VFSEHLAHLRSPGGMRELDALEAESNRLADEVKRGYEDVEAARKAATTGLYEYVNIAREASLRQQEIQIATYRALIHFARLHLANPISA
jgi:hypothetical protein